MATVVPGAVLDGVAPVVEAVAARLEQGVPAELERLETAAGRPVPPVAEGEFDLWRPPGLYARSDRAILEPDDYPAVLTVPQSTDAAVVLDVVDGAAVLHIPYRLRVWAFARHYGAAEVAACRNRLALACLQTLLRSPKLSELMSIELGGWRQSFSDVGVDDADMSTVAGWWLDLIVTNVETVTLDSVARAERIDLVVHPEAD